MTGRSGRSSRSSREKVLAARRQARIAQGRDPDADDLFTTPSPAKAAAPPAPPPSTPRRSEAVGVLMLGEAAARLGISRAELEDLIAAGKLEALPTGYTRMIPTREVERLMISRNS